MPLNKINQNQPVKQQKMDTLSIAAEALPMGMFTSLLLKEISLREIDEQIDLVACCTGNCWLKHKDSVFPSVLYKKKDSAFSVLSAKCTPSTG